MKTSYPFIVLALCLAACGSKNEKIQKNIGQQQATRKNVQASTAPRYSLTYDDFRDYCLGLNGRLDALGETCLTSAMKKITPASPAADLVINANMVPGSFYRTRGDGGSPVDVLVNGKHMMGINEDYLNQIKTGKLAFYVYGTNFTEVNITIWTCQDRNRNRVLCAPATIPAG